ncbi:transglycosylase domain-containing protein [uncultured Propionibacterium sp.]|uniref:transglycosylase domain-containing protein n=1 Tax=uncultured Propionibacterium sp. TaxID=218066 RepID=UPI00292E45AF|nr:transglycosylase domain-containing protein [uncultured Propionibacterium sp.]
MANSKSTPRRPARPGRSRKRRIARIAGMVVAGLVALTLVASGIFYASVDLPEPNEDYTTQTTSIYYRDGTTKIGELSVQNRTEVDYSAMSENMRNAAIAAEDRSFWTNHGVSPKGIFRSLWAIARGQDLQSGSTITQQYIKIRYLTSAQTMTRKLRELALAVKINGTVSKQEILSGYLNTVYFGRGAYGIEKAAENWFNTDSASLNVAQSAMLAALINSPSALDPANGDEAAAQLLERYQYVLDGMLEAGNISQADHDAAYGALPETAPLGEDDTYSGPSGFLMMMAQNELLSAGLTDEQISGGGLKVITTFDSTMQASAVETAQNYTTRAVANAKTSGLSESDLHIGIASVAVGTGEVYALYGGPDYLASQINWAATARPAASTFKAWALLAGLNQGFGLGTVLNGSTFTPSGDSVVVHNDSNVDYGNVTLLKATSYSMNTAFTDLVTSMDDGPQAVVDMANAAGVPTGDGWDLNNRIALGTAQVSPLSNATGFATIANDGRANTTHVVQTVTDSGGATLYTGDTASNQTIDQNVAQNAQTALKSVVTSGTGTTASQLGREVIAKTGTKDDGDSETISAWFVGATKQISTAVMFVAGDGNADLNPYSPYGSFSSGLYPANTWEDYMEAATAGMNYESFSTLNNIGSGSGNNATSYPTSNQSYYPTSYQSAPAATSSWGYGGEGDDDYGGATNGNGGQNGQDEQNGQNQDGQDDQNSSSGVASATGGGGSGGVAPRLGP